MRLGKDLIGKPIITIDQGKHIGKVKDVYIDRDLTQMTGIHLGREGFFRRKDVVILREGVVVYGVDAILIENEESITDSRETDIKSWMKLGDINGREIDTTGGTRLAILGDVILDGVGRIAGFSLSKVLVEGPLRKNNAIAREALIDNGHDDGVMTIDLPKAEELGLPTEAPTKEKLSDLDSMTSEPDPEPEPTPASLEASAPLAESEAGRADGAGEPPSLLELDPPNPDASS